MIALLEAAARAADPGDEDIVVEIGAGEHPVALAEAAVVATLLLRGRLVLLVDRETADALERALREVAPSIAVRYELRAD